MAIQAGRCAGKRGLLSAALAGAAVAWGAGVASAQPSWQGYAGDAQHTAISDVPSQSLELIRWSTPVDMDPQYAYGEYLLIHYGSPMVTSGNTVIVPVKTGATGGFQVEARNGLNGSLLWSQTTDYILPTHNWTPSYAPTLTPTDRLYFADKGGTIRYRDTPDSVSGTTGQLSFFGMSNYNANPSAYDNNVFINTPITSDSAGNIYFGFEVTGSTPVGLSSGIARISSSGVGTWVSATSAASDSGIIKVAMNNAPALSNDGSTVYIAVSSGDWGRGKLLALNSTTLATTATRALLDPRNGSNAYIPDDGTASVTVGPDGRVFYGVLENPLGTNHYRGFMLQYSDNLSQTLTPGAFGWDDTASIVPASMVPGYTGSSTYLIMAKYNNYAGAGGDGVNKVAILDPNDTMTDPITGATVMKEILTHAGVTIDDDYYPGYPNAVREWCINTAAVDPLTKSILVNNEDGKMYRWDLTNNTFSEVVTLTAGLGEAYTPTIIGGDGTVYGINDATLFAIGSRQWKNTGGGNWSSTGNWFGAVPSGSGDTANLLVAITGSAAVNLDSSRTVGTLHIDNPNGYTISTNAGATLTFQAPGATHAVIDIADYNGAGGGAHTISAPVAIASDLDIVQGSTGAFTLSGSLNNSSGKTITKTGAGVLTISGAQTHGSGAVLNANAGTTNLNSSPGPNLTLNASGATTAVNLGVSETIGGLNVTSDATATLTAGGGKLLTLTSLSIQNSGGTYHGALDLKDNNMAIRAPGGTGMSVWTGNVGPAVLAGFNNGAFNNQAITSSIASGAGNTVLAALINDDGTGHVLFANGSDIGSTSGQTEFASLGAMSIDDIVVKYTYYGDVDLSGVVDGFDQAQLDISFGSVGGGWLSGDIDYNGQTDGLDQALLDIFFGSGMGGAFGNPLGSPGSGNGGGATPIPEPASLTLLALGGAGLLRRRRSRRCGMARR